MLHPSIDYVRTLRGAGMPPLQSSIPPHFPYLPSLYALSFADLLRLPSLSCLSSPSTQLTSFPPFFPDAKVNPLPDTTAVKNAKVHMNTCCLSPHYYVYDMHLSVYAHRAPCGPEVIAHLVVLSETYTYVCTFGSSL